MIEPLLRCCSCSRDSAFSKRQRHSAMLKVIQLTTFSRQTHDKLTTLHNTMFDTTTPHDNSHDILTTTHDTVTTPHDISHDTVTTPHDIFHDTVTTPHDKLTTNSRHLTTGFEVSRQLTTFSRQTHDKLTTVPVLPLYLSLPSPP